ncbi:MAG: hypothetical protein QOE01_2700, partial [Actinomycetota bacterium]|nr:hypothetical protein [Actinomycetota bacterium]
MADPEVPADPVADDARAVLGRLVGADARFREGQLEAVLAL